MSVSYVFDNSSIDVSLSCHRVHHH